MWPLFFVAWMPVLVFLLISPGGRNAFMRIMEDNRQLWITIWTGKSRSVRKREKLEAELKLQTDEILRVVALEKLEHENLAKRSIEEWGHTKSCRICYPGYTYPWSKI